MTTELCDDLINFSFDNLDNVFKNYQTQCLDTSRHTPYNIFRFFPSFFRCLKELVCHHFHFCILHILAFTYFMIQPLSEADNISQALQVHFDGMLCNVLEKNHSFPGVTLLLGGIFQYASTKQPYALLPRIVASSYLIRQWGEGHILDDTGLFGTNGLISQTQYAYLPGTSGFFSYLTELLESPKRSGTHIFDQQQYATATKECLQLYLCNHHNFSKAATEFSCHDKAMQRSKPWEWVTKLGIHSRIRKGRHHFKVLQRRSIKAWHIVYQDHFPENSPKHQHYQFLSYRWALDLLPFLLEKSAVSSELADVLQHCTFAMMAWEFPWRMRLAKEAIGKYLLQVESAVGQQWATHEVVDEATEAFRFQAKVYSNLYPLSRNV
jgi:hypothetical protein